MRRVRHRLHKLFKPQARHLVKHERKKDRRQKAKREGVYAQHQRVAYGCDQKRGGKQPFELIKAYPWGVHNPHTYFKILKSDLHPVEGHVMEDDKIRQHGDQEKVQIPCVVETKTQRVLALLALHVSSLLTAAVKAYVALCSVETVLCRKSFYGSS